ncbi:DUF5954 family protein [Streptomyces sp. NPDC007355]|uniref:DUF5954 family protein n=1 Tax=Streptomyces sp. NPDC007355 TaxID=3364778 RepID=UPI0036AFBB1F
MRTSSTTTSASGSNPNEPAYGCSQQARDALSSLLWFWAKNEAKSPQERRALPAAVACLETEDIDELTVLDTRYRVLRAEEYAAQSPPSFRVAAHLAAHRGVPGPAGTPL